MSTTSHENAQTVGAQRVKAQCERLFRAPYAVPNALQMTKAGLWITDQITDRVALVEVTEPSEYGVTKLIRDIPSESSNTSGMAYDGDALWLAANCTAKLWRPVRDHDAQEGEGVILKIDPRTGETLERHLLPGGGGTHGLECDPFEEDTIWLTTLKSQTLSKVRISDWSVQHVIPLPYQRGHGVVRVTDGVWVVHTADRIIAKLDVETGEVLQELIVSESDPQPHGLSIFGDDLVYCDATSGWIVKVML
ncbi:PQQ-like beta-propeller repeat protein [Chloroflexi bacterium TSY]|nr:PQQ-like beta-propeller repeat protein [Chloroflexi bacterium TSY]